MNKQYTIHHKAIIFIQVLIIFTNNLLTSVYAQASISYGNLFTYGVASGDPLPDRVIIWTRVTVKSSDPVSVKWKVAKDEKMNFIVKSGELTSDVSKDYTVKVDVTGLAPATTYYYQFSALNENSIVGRTKTAPLGNPSKLNFAVVSCNNYAEGYFNALGKIAERSNLDAVIHLGDYIYEGTERNFEGRSILSSEEKNTPTTNKEEWLMYYRKRYAISRLDSNLKKAHQRLAFINIWDDHETADNAYKDGANQHDDHIQGSWEARKAAAKQAFAEWVPIRGDASKIYRALKFGNLMELLLLDTRLEGRDKQIYDASDPKIYDANRTILGSEQRQWLLQKLKSSPCTWKVIGNQVIFSEFNIKWAASTGIFADQVQQLESNLLDYWQGYPAERKKIINHITNNHINNVVILSASMHCALAFDVIPSNGGGSTSTYNPTTGKGAVAVEFAAPSISSANFDEKIGSYITSSFESRINKTLPLPLGYNPNPHMKFVDLDQHGYFILEVTPKRAQATYYFVNTIMKPNSEEKMAERWHTETGQNYLQQDKNKIE